MIQTTKKFPLPKSSFIKTVYFVFGLALLLSSAATYYHYLETHRYTLEIEMAAQTDIKEAMVQIFFDTGKGFTQENSQIRSINCDKNFHLLSYTFPIGKVKRLRLDPLNTNGIILLKGIKLLTYQREQSLSFNLNNIHPIFQIKAIHSIEGGVKEIITNPKADDPSLDLSYSPHERYPIDIKGLLTFWIKIFIIYFIGLLTITPAINPKAMKY